MDKSKNPYHKFIVDESSGLCFTNDNNKAWSEGYEAGRRDEQNKTKQPKAAGNQVNN
ncbi:hypothetical protein ACFLX3_03980 [Chloroflexota bacterium]